MFALKAASPTMVRVDEMVEVKKKRGRPKKEKLNANTSTAKGQDRS